MVCTKNVIKKILSDKYSKHKNKTGVLSLIRLDNNDKKASRFWLYKDIEGGGIGTRTEFRKAFPDYKINIVR